MSSKVLQGPLHLRELLGIFASDSLGVIALVITTCFLVRAPLFWSTMNFLVLL